MADSMIGEIITDHRERMINLKKYYPFFRLMDVSFEQYKDGKYIRRERHAGHGKLHAAPA